MITDINQAIQDAIFYRDQPLALEALTYIKKNNLTSISDVELQKLSYVRFSSLSILKASVLLKESLLVAYDIPEFILSEEIERFVSQIEIVLDLIEFVERLETILDECKEIIGGVAVGKLLKDYDNIPQNQRDAFSQTKYLNTSMTKSFPKEQHDAFADILKIYDYCYHIRVLWNLFDELPEEEILKKVNPQTDWVALLPGITAIAPDEEPAPEPAPKPAPKPVAKPRPMEPVANPHYAPLPERPIITLPPRPQPKPKPAPAPVAPQRPAVPVPQDLPERPIITLPETRKPEPKPLPKPKPPANPVHLATPPPDLRSIDEVIRANTKPAPILSRPGVVKDPTNIKIDEEKSRLERERQKKVQAIQDKLAELKARKNKP